MYAKEEAVKFDTVKDMNKFIDKHVSNSKKKKELSDHLEISSHISNEIAKRNLFSLSELEQELIDSSKS